MGTKILDRVAEWLKIDLWLCVTLCWIRIETCSSNTGVMGGGGHLW